MVAGSCVLALISLVFFLPRNRVVATCCFYHERLLSHAPSHNWPAACVAKVVAAHVARLAAPAGHALPALGAVGVDIRACHGATLQGQGQEHT